MTAGRPTLYDPSFCERIIELAKEGKSVSEWASDIGVARSTLWEWAQTHDAFSAAFMRAKTEEQAALERMARENFENKNFNANLWIKSAQARFRDDYTESHKIESTSRYDFTGLPAMPIQTIQFSVIDANPIASSPITIDHEPEEVNENDQ